MANVAQRPVALRQLRKLELSTLGWTERSYENKNELLQLNQQVRKTAVGRSFYSIFRLRNTKHNNYH